MYGLAGQVGTLSWQVGTLSWREMSRQILATGLSLASVNCLEILQTY